MIKITSVTSSGQEMLVSWENSFDSVDSMYIVFDDEGSCTNIGLSSEDTTFKTKKLSMYRTYDVYLKVLTNGGWVTSEPHTYRLA